MLVIGFGLVSASLSSCGDPCAELEQELCDLWFQCADEEARLDLGMTDEEACLTIVGDDLDFLQFDRNQCSGWLEMTSAETCSWPWNPYGPGDDDDSGAGDDDTGSGDDDTGASDDDSAGDDDDSAA